ncbi:MAG: hypothetical protein ACREXI_07060 [Caldimonas sp.]
MNADKTRKQAPDAQRKELAESEKKASETEPRSYDEKSLTDKVVHINPLESDESIQGIDPKQDDSTRNR